MTAALLTFIRQNNLFSATAMIGGALMTAAFIAGLFFKGYQDTIYAPISIGLLLAWLLAVLPRCWDVLLLPRSVFAGLLAAFWFYVTISLLWSTVPFASLVTYIIVLSLPLVFFTLLIARTRMAWIAVAGTALMAALAGLALWAVLQVIALPEQFPRATHPLQNPNTLGELLNLGLIAALPLALWTGRYDKRQLAGLALAALLFAGLLATESRTALLAAGIAAPLFIMIVRPPWRRVVLLGGVLLTVFGAMQAATQGDMISRFSHTFSAKAHEDSVAPRMALLQAGVEMVKDRPFTGTGLGTFYLHYPAYRQPLVDNSAGSWVHNDPLQYAVEMGLAAPALFYALLLAGLWRTVTALRRTNDPRQRMMIAAPFCAFVTLIIEAQASFPLYILPILIVTGVMLAFWHEITRRVLAQDDHATSFHGWQQAFAFVMVAAIAAMIGIMAASSAAGIHYFKQARAALDYAQIEKFILLAHKADELSPHSYIDPQVHLAGLYIDMLVPPAGLMMPHEQAESKEQALQMLAAAEKLNPPWAEINYKRGRLYTVTGAYGLTTSWEGLAEEQYRIALRKNPMHYRAREELARLLLARGAAADAFDLLATGLEYPLPDDIRRSYLPLMRELQGLAAVQRQYRHTPQNQENQMP